MCGLTRGCRYRRLPAGALVALVGLFKQPGAQSNHARDYLSAVARQGRLDFLLRERTLTPAPRNVVPRERLLEKAPALRPACSTKQPVRIINNVVVEQTSDINRS